MKKIMFSAVFAAMLVTNSLSATEVPDVNAKALSAFNSQFANATDVEWSMGSDFYKASFLYNNNYVAAYYNTDGDFVATIRNITSVNLPLMLQTKLKNSYSDYWISDLYELSKNEGTSYYVTLENADQKIVLKSTGDIDWTVHKKSNKA
jgi:hypothetical protein